MAELRKVYWDSNVWLGLINGDPNKTRAAEYVYNSGRAGTYEIWTSTLALTEVFLLAYELNQPKPLDDSNIDKIEEMFEQEFVKLVPVDTEIAKSARLLRRHHAGLRTPDAIHLASALKWSIGTLHTYDAKDLHPFDNKLKMKTGDFLRIAHPDEPSAGPLFDQPPS